MKKILAITILFTILVSGALYVQSKYNKSLKSNYLKDITREDTSNTDNKAQGTPQPITMLKTKAPNFKLIDLTEKEVSLNDYKGKNIFVNFWSSTCPPCRAEMPDIEKLYQETKNTDLVILSICLDDSKITAKSFIAANHYTFDVLYDSEQQAAANYNILYIPTSFFIDKEGYIIASHEGQMDLSQMKSYIQQLDKK